MAQRNIGDEGNLDELAKEVLINMYYTELIESLHSSKSLLKALVDDSIVTQDEYEDTEAQTTDSDKNDKLLMAMRRKSAEQIGRFSQFLIDHGQLHIGGILKSSMSPNYFMGNQSLVSRLVVGIITMQFSCSLGLSLGRALTWYYL